jgi:hypothetical protein
MKQISIFILFFLYFFNIHAQDTINLRNKKVIHAYITEKSDTKIKYKTDSIHAYTTYSTKLSKVKTIHYQNGEVDLLSSLNPRSIFPLGINVGGDFFLFKFLFNGSIDYLFTPKLSAEINYSSMLTESYPAFSLLSIGGKYWFAKKDGKCGFSPFVGLFVTRLRMRNDYDDITYYNKPEWSIYYLPEVPIGISYISRHGFQASLQLDNYIFYNSNKLGILPMIELRAGWRFRTSKKGN